MERRDTVWQSSELTRTFLTGVRGGLPLAAEQIAVMLRLIAGQKAPVRRFLDLGSGDGVLAGAILAEHPAAQVTLVDFSEPMLAAARTRFVDQKIAVEYVHADFGLTGWTSGLGERRSFDLIVSGYAIHHQPDERKRELYEEFFDLLIPGGLFINMEHVASASPWGAALFDELLIDSLTAFHAESASPRSREEVAAAYVHRPDKAANVLAPVEDQCAWLRALDYVDVDCWFKLFEFAMFGGRRPSRAIESDERTGSR